MRFAIIWTGTIDPVAGVCEDCVIQARIDLVSAHYPEVPVVVRRLHGRWETRRADGTIEVKRFRDGQLQE